MTECGDLRFHAYNHTMQFTMIKKEEGTFIEKYKSAK